MRDVGVCMLDSQLSVKIEAICQLSIMTDLS